MPAPLLACVSEPHQTHEEVHDGEAQHHQGPGGRGHPGEGAVPLPQPVSLAGRLVADPELRYTPNVKAVLHIRVATNDTREAQFHDIVAWEEIAEAASERLQKGSPVIVEGRLQTRSWDGVDGAKRRTTEVVATSLTPA